MKSKIIIALLALWPMASFAQEWKKINAKDFAALIQSGSGQIVDVRTSREFGNGYIDGALNIDFFGDNFRQSILALDKAKPVFIYCYGGGRSSEAAEVLVQNGYQVVELREGFKSWREAGLPVAN